MAYRYLQFKPDKSDAWQLVDEKNLGVLGKTPTYISVLSVDQDVAALEDNDEDPLDHVKYNGPMYFDLDCEDDIDAVLASTRELVGRIEKTFGIPPEYIHCWLSGGKGVHITLPQQLFGVNRPLKHLPIIYKFLAKQVAVDYLDMSVYSAGRGRLWRCENLPRPGKGTYKVGVTVKELERLDAQGYEVMVASPRSEVPREEPPSNLAFPKAVTCFKLAKKDADKWVKAVKSAKVVPVEEIRKLQATPGCIKKLITEGDQGASNWNQAAMQVASWIAVRYDRSEEALYKEEVVEPFIENVSSSSRPAEKDRRKHLRDQINRAFSGRTKFLVGSLIATIGEPCGECPLCRGDISFDPAENEKEGAEEEALDKRTRIKASTHGYLHISDNGGRQLTNWVFFPHTEVRDLEEQPDGSMRESTRTSMIGTLVVEGNGRYHDFEIPEDAWGSRSAMVKATKGVDAGVFCTDTDLQKILTALPRLCPPDRYERDAMTYTRVCGIHLERVGKKLLPHYVEAGSSIMATGSTEGSVQSRFRYRGVAKLSPSLIDEDFPYINDSELKQALHHLMHINDPAAVAKMVGWFAACHLREHIHAEIPQFPLLNVWGNASAGKTMSVLLCAHLCGMDYQSAADPVNAENSTFFPILNYVTSSTTVPRLVEEVNESLMHRNKYMQIMAMFKAAWNRSTASRGRLGNQGKSPEVDSNRVSSPIVYVSEQRTTKPALRNRTVEVMLTAAAREKPGRADHFDKAYEKRLELFRAAKAMLQFALNLTPKEVKQRIDAEAHRVPATLDARPKFSMQVVQMGLTFMEEAMHRCRMDISDDIYMLKDALKDDLFGNFKQHETDKRTSEVDLVLSALDQMASDPEDRAGIKAEEHYCRIGNALHLDIVKILPRYKRWCRSVGDIAVIRDATQMSELLEGETYFDRMQPHPHREGVSMHVIDLKKLADKGIRVVNFEESTEVA